ncbi:MAG: YciI family protein [Micromonosporaceae bacterium]
MAEPLPTFLVLYQYVPEMTERRAPHREAHLAWLHSLAGQDSGPAQVLLAGATRDPVDTAVIVVRAADEYAVRRLLLDDPYAVANLITGVTVRPLGLAIGG